MSIVVSRTLRCYFPDCGDTAAQLTSSEGTDSTEGNN